MKKLFVSSLAFLLFSTGFLRAAIEEIVAEREENIVRIFVKGDFDYEVLKLPPPDKGLVVYIKSPLPEKYRGKSYTFGGVRIRAESTDGETRIYMRSPMDFEPDHYRAGSYLVVSMTLKAPPKAPTPPKPETTKTAPKKEAKKPLSARSATAGTAARPSRKSRKGPGLYSLRIRGAKEELVLQALSVLEGRPLFPRNRERRVYATALGLTFDDALNLIIGR